MCDESIIYAILREIEDSIKLVLGQTDTLRSPTDLTDTQDGVFKMGGICMQLIFIGEKVKMLDNKTNGEFLSRFPEIPWKEIKGLRNIIVHEYHRVDEDEIFSVVKNDLPTLLTTIRRMQLEI